MNLYGKVKIASRKKTKMMEEKVHSKVPTMVSYAEIGIGMSEIS